MSSSDRNRAIDHNQIIILIAAYMLLGQLACGVIASIFVVVNIIHSHRN